jgi:hypothetical protein
MVLTHESGSQEDQFDEKKWRQKISWDYPFKGEESTITKCYRVTAITLRLHFSIIA